MRFKPTLLIGTILCGLVAVHAVASDINAMTFNLRVPIDPAPYDWQSRMPRIISIVQNQKPDFVGVQEVTPEMLGDLRGALSGYEVVGRGRELGEKGEGTQILFLKNRWALDPQDHGTLQLSPTPDITGSNGWGMSWPRIFTWVHLREKKTGAFIYVFNTHFPLVAKERYLSVQLLAKAIAGRKHQRDPVILTGDFNACEDEASMTYLLGQGGSPITMKDTYRALHPDGKAGTFHDFGKTESCKIDYIYTLGDVEIISSDVIKESEKFSSDHYAVIAKLRF